MRLRIRVALIGWALLGLASEAGCRPRRGGRTAATRPQASAALDPGAFGTDPITRGRILGMSFAQLADQLGSLQLSVRSAFVISRDSEQYEQVDQSSITLDDRHNFVVRLSTPASSLELHQIGEAVYVRYDRGSLRRKTRRDMATEPLRDIVVAALPQGLAMFRGVAFVAPQPDRVDGRPATRYRIIADESEAQPPSDVPPQLQLPWTPPPLWLAQSRPAALDGFISIDSRTGVVLRAQVEGRLEILDRAAAPTLIKVHIDQHLTKVGKVAALQPPPRALSEFRRPLRRRDPLAFFRDQLPSVNTREAVAPPKQP